MMGFGGVWWRGSVGVHRLGCALGVLGVWQSVNGWGMGVLAPACSRAQLPMATPSCVTCGPSVPRSSYVHTAGATLHLERTDLSCTGWRHAERIAHHVRANGTEAYRSRCAPIQTRAQGSWVCVFVFPDACVCVCVSVIAEHPG